MSLVLVTLIFVLIVLLPNVTSKTKSPVIVSTEAPSCGKRLSLYVPSKTPLTNSIFGISIALPSIDVPSFLRSINNDVEVALAQNAV